MIPFFTIDIDESVDGMDYMGLVDYPAHSKSWVTQSKKDQKPIRYKFNDEQMIITGVGIAVDLPIYRFDEQFGEHWIIFKRKQTQKIVEKMMASGYQNNVNEMHDLNRSLTGVTFLEGWFWDSQRGKTDSFFADQNIKDGSWIVSYKVHDRDTWEKIKSGQWAGFSIEGWFNKVPLRVKGPFKNKNNKKMKKGKMWKLLFGAEAFASAVTTDGIEIFWEGDLSEGTEITIMDEAGERVLAPEGDHSIENEDGSMTVVSVDANGIAVAVEKVEASGGDSDDESLTAEDIAEVIEEAMKRISNQIDEKLKKVKEANAAEITKAVEDFKSKMGALADELDKQAENGAGEKFKRKTGKTWRDFSK